MRTAVELLVKAGRAKGKLSRSLMHVEGPALLAGVRSDVKLVDSEGDAVDLEDASEDQAAQTRSNDRDGGRRHGCRLLPASSQCTVELDQGEGFALLCGCQVQLRREEVGVVGEDLEVGRRSTLVAEACQPDGILSGCH